MPNIEKLIANEEKAKAYRKEYYRKKKMKSILEVTGEPYKDANDLLIDRATLQVGKIAQIPLWDGAFLDVRLLDAKVSYGKARFLVEPLAGSGSAWVQNIQPVAGTHRFADMSIDFTNTIK